ncbi:MAG: FUSC family protein [Sarcina sp.]
MKKLFSIKTISIYLVGCLFILMSIYGLGSANLMVGGFGVFLLKAITNKDFSVKPLTSILNISMYTLAIGILPFLVNLNLYTGLIINFVSVFLILYMLVYSLRETIYVPFLLGYAFFLSEPATGHELKLRLIGLLIIAVVSVIFQIVFYRLKGPNLSLNNLSKSLSLITELIETKINDGDFASVKTKLETHNLAWNKDILNQKQNEFYLTKAETVQINLISTIRSLKFKIDKLDKKNSNIDLNEVVDLLSKLKDFANGKCKRYILIETFSYFNNKYKKDKNLDNDTYEIKESLDILFVFIINFYDIEHGVIKVSTRSKLRDYIELEKGLFKDFRRGSSRFTFAFRTALLMALTYFFVTFFNLKYGHWALYTIVSISQPYYDVTKQKAFDRLRGTIIGGLIFTFLNLIFRGFDARIVIIFIAIYFLVYLTDYSKRITAATVMALMIVSTSSSHMLLITFDRLFFVMIGAIIVVIGSLLILPYKLENEIYDLSNIYFETCEDAICSLLTIYDGDEKQQDIHNMILTANNIESKISVKNSAYDIKIIEEFLSNGRIVLDTIQKILNRMYFYDTTLLNNKFVRLENLKQMKEYIDNLSEDEFKNGSFEHIISKYIKLSKSKSELLIYKDVFDILVANRRLQTLKKNMDKKS